MTVTLIDTHCHLTLGDLAPQAEAAWQRAQDAGVCQALVIGIDAATSRAAQAFVADHAGLHCSVGIHPNSTQDEQPGDWEQLVALAAAPKVVALGETGVDLYRDYSDLPTQRRSLERHAELGLARDLPLVLHVRDAYPQTAEILAPYAECGLRAVVHCFTGGPRDLQPFVEWGFAISFSGVLTYKNAPEVREAAAQVPLDQCLVETDAPWLAPTPHRGKLNEPAFVIHTARRLAEVQQRSFEEVARATTENARRLFRLAVG